MYLEPIFSSPDIMAQLPLEGKRFATVDRTWRRALAAAAAAPAILEVCSSSKLLEQFNECNAALDSVQKGLANYLETKRLAFARCDLTRDMCCRWCQVRCVVTQCELECCMSAP
jgi:dynein heavy chain, axonemal